MNYLTIIFIILFALSLTDFIYPRQEKLHKQMYAIAFGLTYFLFTIKYYYGGDIIFYSHLYDSIASPVVLLSDPSNKLLGNYMEPGFLLFLSTLKHLGFSFWMMTAIVSTIYFYAIYLLFKKIPSKKTFALLILVVLDFNLIFATFRQCLAVSFFIFMLLAYIDKKYWKSILFLILALSMHKSTLFACAFLVIALTLKSYKSTKHNYYFLIVLLFLFSLFSFSDTIRFILEKTNASEWIIFSVEHHLLLAQRLQSIFVLYFITIFTVAFYYRNEEDTGREKRIIQWVSFVALLMVVVLYQYWYLLTRFRSFFIPIVLVFVFRLLHEHKAKYIWFRQGAVICIYLLFSALITRRAIEQNNLESGIYDTSTIFSRITKSEEQIKKEQLRKANIFWSKEFGKPLEQSNIND